MAPPSLSDEFKTQSRKLSFSNRDFAIELGAALANEREDIVLRHLDKVRELSQSAGDSHMLSALVNTPVWTNDTSLCLAIEKRMPEAALALLAAGARPDFHGRADRAPLCMAISSGQTQVALAIIAESHGNDPVLNGFGQHENPPMFLALINKQGDVAKALAKAGAHLGLSNQLKTTPLLWACLNSMWEAATEIAIAMAPKNDGSRSPCSMPIQGKIGTGDVNFHDKKGRQAWDWAWPGQDDALCSALIRAGADRHIRAQVQSSPTRRNLFLEAIGCGLPHTVLSMVQTHASGRSFFKSDNPRMSLLGTVVEARMEKACVEMVRRGYEWSAQDAHRAFELSMWEAAVAMGITDAGGSYDASRHDLIHNRLGYELESANLSLDSSASRSSEPSEKSPSYPPAGQATPHPKSSLGAESSHLWPSELEKSLSQSRERIMESMPKRAPKRAR